MRIAARVGLNTADYTLGKGCCWAKQVCGAIGVLHSCPDPLLFADLQCAFQKVCVRVLSRADGVIASPDCGSIERSAFAVVTTEGCRLPQDVLLRMLGLWRVEAP